MFFVLFCELIPQAEILVLISSFILFNAIGAFNFSKALGRSFSFNNFKSSSSKNLSIAFWILFFAFITL